jgi:hypothetical protein
MWECRGDLIHKCNNFKKYNAIGYNLKKRSYIYFLILKEALLAFLGFGPSGCEGVMWR